MAQDLFQYDKMVETALRGVVREALARAARDGLRGGHHFYISFRTGAPGVVLPPQILAKYPEDMTIVLQHQFWGLEVGDAAFSVTLSFNKPDGAADHPVRGDHHLCRPVGQVRPAVRGPGGSRGRAAETARPDGIAGRLPAGEKAGTKPAGEKNEAERPAAEIVTLDRFRKR